MRSFKTKSGQWDAVVTVGTIDRIKSRTGIDLLDDTATDEAGQPVSAIVRLLTGEWDHIKAVYASIERQALEAGIDYTAFLDELTEETDRAAHTAFAEALADFFRARGQMHRAEVIEQILETIREAIKVATAAVEREGQRARSGITSTGSPGLSASIPPGGRSEPSSPPPKDASGTNGADTPR